MTEEFFEIVFNAQRRLVEGNSVAGISNRSGSFGDETDNRASRADIASFRNEEEKDRMKVN